jgi:hypothetical protein
VSLLDVAVKLNKHYEVRKKAEEERVRQAELHARKLSYYGEFGKQWFNDLTEEMDKLIAEFNSVTGEHSKLNRIHDIGSPENTLVVQLMQSSRDPTDPTPTCIIRRENSDLKVVLEIEHLRAPYKENYDVVVRDFSRLTVRVNTVTEKESLGEGVQWRNRETGETEYAPTFVTKKIRNSLEFNANEFADYALSTFAEKML